jgi:hypothetical protein
MDRRGAARAGVQVGGVLVAGGDGLGDGVCGVLGDGGPPFGRFT